MHLMYQTWIQQWRETSLRQEKDSTRLQVIPVTLQQVFTIRMAAKVHNLNKSVTLHLKMQTSKWPLRYYCGMCSNIVNGGVKNTQIRSVSILERVEIK